MNRAFQSLLLHQKKKKKPHMICSVISQMNDHGIKA